MKNQPARLYVVGDIHGCLSPLENLQRQIQEDAASYDGHKTLVYIGDYIDRGLESKQVVENLCTPLAGFDDVYNVVGNHELHWLRFAQHPLPEDVHQRVRDWIFKHGGQSMLASYGVRTQYTDTLEDIQDRAFAAVPEHHKTFYSTLHKYVKVGEFLCVHGGIDPNVALEDHDDLEMLVYPRPPAFKNHGWEETIIFGHTIHDKPLVEHDRIGVDTGAYTGGKLTCAVLTVGEGAKTVRFLQA